MSRWKMTRNIGEYTCQILRATQAGKAGYRRDERIGLLSYASVVPTGTLRGGICLWTVEAPQGFGVRQSSGALAMEASRPKAPEDWRSPRRYRAIRNFRVPMQAKIRNGALHERQLDWTR